MEWGRRTVHLLFLTYLSILTRIYCSRECNAEERGLWRRRWKASGVQAD